MTHALCVLAGMSLTTAVTLNLPGYVVPALIFGAAAMAIYIIDNTK